MSSKDRWGYFNETERRWTDPTISIQELDKLHADGKINDKTLCINVAMLRRGPKAQGIAYNSIARHGKTFHPDPDVFLASRMERKTTVLSGPNNCGKTLFLKQVFSEAGHGAFMVSCNRFSHVDVLNTQHFDESQYENSYNNFVQGLFTSKQNTEESEYKLEHAITRLSNTQREHLFSISGELLGTKFSLKRIQANNEFSPFYVDMDGQNLRYGSTGTRLLLTLLGILLEDRLKILLIDEPEIGLSPRIQSAIASLLYDPDSHKKYWPHLNHLFIATHSHLFLDRRNTSNNYVVERKGDIVTVSPVRSISELHQLQFNMLGNDFESLLLPSAIVIVEGSSDLIFLSRVITVRIKNKKIAIVRAYGDGEVLSKINVLREAFGSLDSSPYKSRLFVVLDKVHSVSIDRIKKAGVLSENIKVWSKNGIEYFYPAHLVASAFKCDPTTVNEINREQDPIKCNGMTLTKNELAQHVSDHLTETEQFEAEFEGLLQSIFTASQ